MASMYDAMQALKAHKALKAGNVSSDGVSLWSYGWWEMARWIDGELIARQGPSYSQSTSCQQTRCRLWELTPAQSQTPRRQGPMEL